MILNSPLSQTRNHYYYSDFVTIYDGSNEQSTEIAQLTGNLGSFNISSTGKFLFVKFEADQSYYYGNGFFATIHYGISYLNINLQKWYIQKV